MLKCNAAFQPKPLPSLTRLRNTVSLTSLPLAFFLVVTCYAQPREISKNDLSRIHQRIDSASNALKQQLEKSDFYRSDNEKKVAIEFALDTFRVEEAMSLKMGIDYSTAGMANACYDAEKEYDSLIVKYYNRLISLLIDSDKQVLQRNQAAWKTYRKSQNKLIATLMEERYTGGGTMWIDISASYALDEVRQRLIDLYFHPVDINTE